MNSVRTLPTPSRSLDYLRKARALLQLAGASDDIETRRAISDQAAINLAAYKAMMMGGRA